MKWFSVVLVCLFLPINAHTMEQKKTTALITSPLWMYIEGQSVIVIPQNATKDNCWSNEKETATSIEIELKRSGFRILDGIPSNNRKYPLYISIKGSGYEVIGSGCISSYEVVVSYKDINSVSGENGHKINFFEYTRLWSSSGIMSGPKGDFSKRLKETYVSLIQKFLVDIDKNKAKIVRELDADPVPENRIYWTRKFNLNEAY